MDNSHDNNGETKQNDQHQRPDSVDVSSVSTESDVKPSQISASDDSKKSDTRQREEDTITECNRAAKTKLDVEDGSIQNQNGSPIIENFPADKSSQQITETFKEDNSSSENVIDKSDGNGDSAADRMSSIPDDDPDDGDPIPSGTGVVSRECSANDLMGWSEILPKWHNKLNQRPKGLAVLVRNGIPEPLRGEVWQLLSGVQQYSNLMDQYRIYLTKSAPSEQIILRDVHRTYPAHENFRTGAGSSSLLDSLFKVCKAYAVYDEEVGYCQGLSFLVAALLLHMPEEQAFCVFVCIMQHYGLRDLFRNNFDELYLKFHQLERLLEEHMPDLYQHFKTIGIEPFTYASQWFLTVFTAKFPLNAVFYIMDIFLLDGMNTIFQVALALLGASKQDLLALDFEGVLKYFRVQMPKRYRNQENVKQLISASTEISLKRLNKHAKSYEQMKQKEKLLEQPVTRLQRENAKLTENNIRLEQENDDLARDLVASKIQLRAQLDILEDKTDTLNKALTYSRQDCQSYLNTISDMEDERARLEVEVSQLKEVCRRELQRAESESTRDNSIIADYKKICSQLSKRLDHRRDKTTAFIESMKDLLRDNELCQKRACFELFCSNADEFIESLNHDQNFEQASPSSSVPSQGNSPKSKTSNSLQELPIASIESDPSNRPIGAYLKTANDTRSTSSEHKIQRLTEHVDELEVELARTKLALVEAECRCQQLTHDLSVGVTFESSKSNNRKQDQQTSTSHASSLSNKLVFMRDAISSSRKSPKSANMVGGSSGTFAKLNNIISGKISNMSQVHPTLNHTSQIPNSKSTPLIANITSNKGDRIIGDPGRANLYSKDADGNNSGNNNNNHNSNVSSKKMSEISDGNHQC